MADVAVAKTEKNSSESQTIAKIEKPIGKKHPLQSEWALWYFINDKNIRWEDSQIRVANFGTVEDFWALFNHIENGSRLKTGCDYSLFREGIQPMWEDQQNKDGGKWLYNSPIKKRRDELDNLFLDLMLMLIGETGGSVSDDCNGVVLSIRNRGDRLALWTRTAFDTEKIRASGMMMKECLRLSNNQLEFTRHADAAASKRGAAQGFMTL